MRLVFKVILFFFVVYTGLMVYMVVKSASNTVQSIKYCETGEDCVQVKAFCCGCEQGGENTCINHQKQEAWDADLGSKCGNVMCIQLYNCVPSECQCINNTCVLKKI